MPPARAWLVVLVLGCGSRSAEQRGPTAATPATPATAATATLPPTMPGPSAPPGPGATSPPAVCQAAPLALGEAGGRLRPGSMFGVSKRRETSAEICQVADSNLASAETAILALPKPAYGGLPVAWDRKQAPARLDQIERRFGLTAAERRQLTRDGFVVSARLEQPSWGWAYHEIYQSQLPIYVSADSILHAVYAAHDGMVARLERTELAPRLAAMLAAMHCTLPTAAARYPDATARDLDLFLAVARGLLEERDVASVLGDAAVSQEARALVAKAKAAGPMETRALFGRDRVIDFSQYQPRGHYTAELAPYFRAAMWLSRLELNIVSRSSRSSAPGDTPDPRETPREAIAALALADLAAASGQAGELDRIEQVFALLAGRREDIPPLKLAELARTAGIADLRAPGAAEKLRAAVGDTYQRTARIHYMPQGSTVLPAISTLLGPRITDDTVALRPLAHSEIPNRNRIRGGDLAYVLGHDRGREYLKEDLARYPTLPAALDRARKIVATAPRGGDLYGAWLEAIRALAIRPAGATPSYMESPAFADLRMTSALAAYSQLRHNHVLIAGQSYGEGGCEIPDGYVEPVPAVYDALAAYADLGAKQVGLLGAGAQSARAYFERLGKIARVLAAISRIELANQPLPAAALRWLSMVVEILPYGSDGRPTYTGWYFDLFEDRADAIARPDLIADYFTSTAGVSYIGVAAPRMGVFVVDTGGGPRAMVGPVTHAYEHQGAGAAPRLTDDTALQLAATARIDPWTARYTAAAPPVPSFIADLDWDSSGRVMKIEALQPIPSLTIQILDHHRVPIAKVTRAVPKGKSRIPLPTVGEDTPLRTYGFIAGDFRAVEDPCHCCGCNPMAFGSFKTAPPRKDGGEDAGEGEP